MVDYYKRLKKFHKCFCEAVKANIRYNEFFLYIEMFSGSFKPDLYKIDYQEFYNFLESKGYL